MYFISIPNHHLCSHLSSDNWKRPSYFAFKYLQGKGYRVLPVNPASKSTTILGEHVFRSLEEVKQSGIEVDMLDIFRNSDAALDITQEALDLDMGFKTVWMQLGVENAQAEALAKNKGLNVVQDRCPKIEYARLFGELVRSVVSRCLN